MTKQELNKKLIDHYKSFNAETFWLDDFIPGEAVMIQHHTFQRIDFTLCKWIAAYIHGLVDVSIVYVGAFFFTKESSQ